MEQGKPISYSGLLGEYTVVVRSLRPTEGIAPHINNTRFLPTHPFVLLLYHHPPKVGGGVCAYKVPLTDESTRAVFFCFFVFLDVVANVNYHCFYFGSTSCLMVCQDCISS